MFKALILSIGRVPLVWRILAGFALGIVGGLLAQRSLSPGALSHILPVLAPFGGVLVAMLKMVVYPIIFFSLVMGAASLPLRQSGKVGGTVLVWYALTSLVAAVLGVALALALNPSMTQAGTAASAHAAAAQEMLGRSQGGGTFASFFLGLFVNPFEALEASSRSSSSPSSWASPRAVCWIAGTPRPKDPYAPSSRSATAPSASRSS